MARKPIKTPSLPSPWHIALWVLVLICVTLGGVILYTGMGDDDRAFADGRRFVINLASGEITGLKPGAPAKTPPVVIPEAVPSSDVPTSENSDTPPAASSDTPATTSDVPPAVNSDAAVSSDTGEPQFSDSPVAKDDELPLAATAEALPAINPSLIEKHALGALPMISPDGTKPWRYYSRPYDHRGGLPMIAIIVSGIGANKAASYQAIKLPNDITLSLSPYARDVSKWAASARAVGHEVFIDLPLQANDYPATDPGPLGILLTQSAEENKKNLQQIMARAAGFSGFLMPQNEAYSANNDSFKFLLQSIGNHGLMIVVGREPHKTETREIIDTSHTPSVIADAWIDEDPSASGIASRLSTLEQIAKKRGYAIGIAQAFPITLEQLQEWSKHLAEKGVVLVPVTFIAKPRFS